MRAVMTVTGKDIIGILAEVSGKCSELNVNITEVTQSVLQDLFCMIMLVDTEKCSVPLLSLCALSFLLTDRRL